MLINGEAYKLEFLRKTFENYKFIFLQKEDTGMSWIQKNKIIPRIQSLRLGTTTRKNRNFSFQIKVPEKFENVCYFSTMFNANCFAM